MQNGLSTGASYGSLKQKKTAEGGWGSVMAKGKSLFLLFLHWFNYFWEGGFSLGGLGLLRISAACEDLPVGGGTSAVGVRLAKFSTGQTLTTGRVAPATALLINFDALPT